MIKLIMCALFISLFVSCSLFKNTAAKNKADHAGALAVNSDSTKADTSKAKLRPYKDVIGADAVTQNGLLKVHQSKMRYYFELPSSLLGKDMLAVNRISKGAAEGRGPNALFGYAGDYIGENVVRFEKGPDYKLFIKRISYLEISNDSSENGMYRSVLNSTLQPIVAAFDIKAISPDSSAFVIDVTDYLNGDNDVFFFATKLKKLMGLGAVQADKSYIQKISSFPRNAEIKTIKTYTANDQLLTYELNSSLILLPDNPMQPRYNDDRVGYFARKYIDYDNAQQVKATLMITRWRLEPKAEDIERYKRGELVEPKKPIIFYIDPATPKKWVPYLIKGVNAWQRSFEKAGFKNAIYALEAPVQDSTWNPDDARHNVIVYKASYLQNASGPQVSDPRSGEILESHVNWYHNVQQLLQNWYFIQASPNDPRARKMVFDDTLMGELIQYVCTHEVGHTLGLQHNFMASFSIPVDSLRSKEYVAVNGHTPSIMDYARFNYVAQPEDNIAVKDLVPRIGVYDDWAIEWGYKWLPGLKDSEQERTWLNQWIIDRTGKDKRLLFNNSRIDLRVETEDLGDDPVKAGHLGIKNLKVVMSHLKEWTKTPNDLYTNAVAMKRQVENQFDLYLQHVMVSLECAYWLKKSVEQPGNVIGFPSREKLRAAVEFFQEELFTTPQWLDNKELFLLIGGGGEARRFQEWYIHDLVSTEMYQMLLYNEQYQPQARPYTYTELLTDLEAGIFKELVKKDKIDFYRRNLQKIYITRLINNVRLQKVGALGRMDFTTITEDDIRRLYQRINKVLSSYPDNESKLHLADIAMRLKVALDYQHKNYPEKEEIIEIKNPASIDLRQPAMSLNGLTLPFHKEISKGCWEQ